MFTRKEEMKHHVPAKVRAYGRARIEIAQRAQTRQEWDELWKPPSQPFAFEWGENWKQCIEYKVADFTAEVGFFIDLLGLPVNAFNEDYAMFTSPSHDFYFAVVPSGKGKATPPDAIRLQFMVADLFETFEQLRQRGIHFHQEPQPVSEGSNQWVAAFQTPNGICMEIWGWVVPQEEKSRATELEEAQEREPASIEKAWVQRDRPTNLTPDLTPKRTQFEEEDDETEELNDEVDEEEDGFEDESEEMFEMDIDEDESEPEQASLETSPRKPAKNIPVRSFQNAEEMLEHLKQKETHKESSPRPLAIPAQPGENNRPSFSPAPKKTPASKPDSVWDSVNLNEEYVEVNESETEEYHYRPIPLTRDE